MRGADDDPRHLEDDLPPATLAVIADRGLGRRLDISVLVEGVVETADQPALLRSEGGTAAQGFLFGRPRPVAEV